MLNTIRFGAILGIIGAAVVAAPDFFSFAQDFEQKVEKRTSVEALEE